MKKKKFSWTKRVLALLVLSGIGVVGMESYHRGFVVETIGRVIPAWRSNPKEKRTTLSDEVAVDTQSVSVTENPAAGIEASPKTDPELKREALPAPLNPSITQKVEIKDQKKEPSKSATPSEKSSDQASEKPSDKASEKSSDQAITAKVSDKASESTAVKTSPVPKAAASVPASGTPAKPSEGGVSGGIVSPGKDQQSSTVVKTTTGVSTALFEDLVNAYIYAYPFVLMNTMESEMTKSLFFAPKNKMAYFTVLPSPHIKVAECPNVDSLMSTAWLDLTAEPQVVCMPAASNNSYIMELVDTWTNVVDTFGGNQTSDFPMAELDGRKIRYFIVAGPSSLNKCPKGSKVIVSPTNNLWLINRVLFGVPRSENDPGIAATARTLYEFEIVPLKLFEKEVLKKKDKESKAASSKITRIKRLKMESDNKVQEQSRLGIKKDSGAKSQSLPNNSLKIQDSSKMKNSRTNSEKLLPLVFPSAGRYSAQNDQTVLTGGIDRSRSVNAEDDSRYLSVSFVNNEDNDEIGSDENKDNAGPGSDNLDNGDDGDNDNGDDDNDDEEDENDSNDDSNVSEKDSSVQNNADAKVISDENELTEEIAIELPDTDDEINTGIQKNLQDDISLQKDELDDEDELEETEELDSEPENREMKNGITFVQYRRARARDYNMAYGQRPWNGQTDANAQTIPQSAVPFSDPAQPVPYQQQPSYSQQVPTVIIESVQAESDEQSVKPDTKLKKLEREGVNALEEFRSDVDSGAAKSVELTEKAGSKLKQGARLVEQTAEKAGQDVKKVGKEIEKISDKAWDKTKDAAKESVDFGRNAAEYMDRRFRRDAARFANHLGFWFDWTSRTEMPADKVERMSPEEFFSRFAKAYAENPLPAGDQKMDELLKKLGLTLSSGEKKISPNAQIRYLMRFATPYAQGRINQKAIYDYCQAKKVNSWYIPENFGRYGTDYLRRAIVANEFIGANVPEQILYPFTLLDGKGEFLTGANNYVLHFPAGQTPPADLLWSITMYDQRRALVANRLDRYAIRSNLPLVYNQDGSLDILISHEEPGENLSNWLPAPKGEFMLMMRIYQPKKEALNGQWQVPPVIKVGPVMKKAKEKI